MDYYNILNFKKEPFSNSPEPEFLFQLPQQTSCLQKLELAVRLRRGINVVIGDIGAGKTTLCRKLIRNFSSVTADSAEIETHLLLDPAFNSVVEFLQTVALMLGIKDLNNFESEWHLKERIKNYLFDKGVDEKKIIVLIIDEGQKIPENCLEILREFLNYETNNFKLLQIIIFAQKEFQTILKKHPNLLDRVNLLYHLQPLSFKQMRAMINHRLRVARDNETAPSLFTFGGLVAVYLATGGYPRKVVILCHQVVLTMIIRQKNKAGWFMVRSCINDMATPSLRMLKWALGSVSVVIIVSLSLGAIVFQRQYTAGHKQLAGTLAIPMTSNAEKTDPVFVSTGKVSTQQDEKKNWIMPECLGKLTMTKRRTLWWTAYNIYGEARPEIINALTAANPHIKNKNIIVEGEKIELPLIPADIKPITDGDIIAAVESGKDLEIVYNVFQDDSFRQKMPAVVFFSFWNKKDGINFAIVIDKCFRDIRAAQEAIGKLPPPAAEKTKILSQWDADTVFFNRRKLQR